MAPTFGKEFKEEFLLDKDYAHLTHGSFGTWPKIVHEAQRRMHEVLNKEPDGIFRYRHTEIWLDNIKVAAKFLGSRPENLVFVENATSGVNIALKNLLLKPGDGILIFSWTYKAIQNACHSAAYDCDAEVIYVEMELPIKDKSQIIKKYKDCIAKHPNIKVAILDYITSPTATYMPLKELLEICKESKIISIIDGAHTPGQITLNLESLGGDFFVGNFHKWVFTPRSCAVLWVHPRFQKTTKPLITSHIYNNTDFRLDFVTQGTRDYTAYYVCKDGIEFFESIGGLEAIRIYASELLQRAVQLLCCKWNTNPFPIPAELEAPYMRVVELPQLPRKYDCLLQTDKTNAFSDMDALNKVLFFEYKVTSCCLGIHNKAYTRICASVYNTIEDYERLADAVLHLCKSDSG